MRLLYLSEAVIPSRLANAVHVMKMSAALAANGNQVSLLAVKGDDAEAAGSDLFAHYGVAPDFELIRLGYPSFKGGSLIYPLRCARRVRAVKPELVYGRYPRGMALAAAMGYDCVLETHLPVEMMDPLSLRAFRLMERSGRLKRLVVISQVLKEMLIPQTTVKDILVAHDAVDLPSGDLPPASGFPPDKFNVGYVGNLYEGRGGEVVLEMARQTPRALFHLVGGRPEELARWKERDLPPNLIMHGFAPPSKVAAMQASCQALLMPYQRRVDVPGQGDTSRWMSPLKMFEYMASGAPIISSDLPVLREVLADGENALLVEPDEAGAWVTALKSLMEDRALASRLADRAAGDVAQGHTWRIRAGEVLAGL